ncbi:uncharacterized protein N7483_003880 [Penicillium malachiteum]|uniref:uncharacterized protein n=1 Tax=Penicillium malachiteum TaxID=1324776 RepID=UPI0025472F85|nr:uncharacterized protein N7483_003880 [Penicillium malachiteum]KAJ5729372.1 hypothetical protein N7483_003880 [Penicillium malachiteum]
MPFYGRPSKNCESCRERRIKCDRIQPTCSQCKRAGKTCGGYRDIPAFMFRDETDKAAQRSALAKSRSAEREGITQGSTLSHTSSSKRSTRDQSKTVVLSWKLNQPSLVISVPASVPTNVENQGLNFFFTQFVTEISGIDDFSFILSSSHLLGTPTVELPLQNAAISIGLAALSNVTRDRSLLLVAREKYVSCINLVRQAVENPDQANPDLILKLILMLGLYEMVCCNPNQIDMWTIHLDGAAALLKQTTFGRVIKARDPRAQMQYFYISMVRYFLIGGDVPEDILNFNINTIRSSHPDDIPGLSLIGILVRFMRLHSARNDPAFDPAVNLLVAINLDTELEEWEQGLPEKWKFTVEHSDDMQHTFHGKYILYKDLWASRDLNHYFWGRLAINEFILNLLATLATVGCFLPNDAEQRQRSLDTASRMAMDACAGAASQLGTYASAIPYKRESRVPRLNIVFMLLFPLTIAGSSTAAPDEVHEWVVQKLQEIGSSMGIQRAVELIPRIKQSRAVRAQR